MSPFMTKISKRSQSHPIHHNGPFKRKHSSQYDLFLSSFQTHEQIYHKYQETIGQSAIFKQLKSLETYARLPVQFDRRITHIEWLSSTSDSYMDYFVGISSKSGDLLLYHTDLGETGSWLSYDSKLPMDRRSDFYFYTGNEKAPTFPMVRGFGAGHSIYQFKFAPQRYTSSNTSLFSNNEPVFVYSATASGFLQVHDMLGYTSQTLPRVLLRTDDAHTHWFTSLALCPENNLLVVGTTKGEIFWTDLRQAMTSTPSYSRLSSNGLLNGSSIISSRKSFSWVQLHKGKIQDLAFSKINPNWLLSGSNDRNVCLWDWRYIKSNIIYSRNDPVHHDNITDLSTFYNRDEDEDLDEEVTRIQDQQGINVHSHKSSHSCKAQEHYQHIAGSSVQWKGLGAIPLSIMPQHGVVTSLEWDPIHQNRFLTTTQNSECRVYDIYASAYDNKHQGFNEEPSIIYPKRCIQHPHRHFQHMTNIKATWHPTLSDVYCIGRYPDMNNPIPSLYDHLTKEELNAFKDNSTLVIEESDQIDTRLKLSSKTIDCYKVESGTLFYQLINPLYPGIQCLVKFHPGGDVLASASGNQVFFWRPKEKPWKSLDSHPIREAKDDHHDSGCSDNESEDGRSHRTFTKKIAKYKRETLSKKKK